ncbi:GTPase activating protein (GAP) for Rho1p, partial [Coemansia aciculifera]
MNAAEGRSSSAPRQKSPRGSVRSGSTSSSHSSTNSERYHLASTDGTPESEEHAHYTNVQMVGEGAGGTPHFASTQQQHFSDSHSSLRRSILPQPHQGHSIAVPQTVTATIVDPTAMAGMSGAGRPYSGHASLTDVPARVQTRHFSSGNYDADYNSHRAPQPTLAALALADSRGHLDSGLGYYQQPHRIMTNFGHGHGFRSEPASGAGSPTNRTPAGHGTISADNTVTMGYHTRTPPSASALGVMFSAPMAQRSSNDGGRSMDRDYVAFAASEAKLRGVRHAGSAAARSPAMSDILHDAHHFHQHRSGFSSGSSPQIPDGGRGFYSGDDSSQAGASRSQLSVLPENVSIKSFHDERGNENNRHMAQSSTEFAPHASSSPSISAAAASLTAASSFSFRNSQTQFASSHPLPSQSSYGSNSNNRHSTATTTTATNRDSMFLRLKEKMKSFKPRSRPQSDNFADRRSAAGAPHGAAGSQPLPTSILGSPSFNKANRGTSTSSEPLLFGMSLSSAVKVAGVHVGSVAESGEICIVPTVVAVCGRHLCEQGQQTQGIFRVNGSMKRVQLLQDEFCERPLYGRHVEWSKYTLHDAATILRRYLISLPESVISAAHYNAFLDKLAESLSDSEKAHDYSLLIGKMTPESRHTLLYMLELLSVFARADNCALTLMNASNLAAVLQPCLLVHPGHVANPHEYSKAKDVVEFLIEHASELHTTKGPLSTAHQPDTTESVDDPQQQQQQQQHGDGFVMVGQSGLSGRGGFGAGLIIATVKAGRNPDGEHGRGIASDDGTTLHAVTRDSGLATVHSADSAIPPQPVKANFSATTVVSSTSQTAPDVSQQARSAAESSLDVPGLLPPARDSSMANANLNMSTPTMGRAGSSRGHVARPLGS